MLKTSLPEASFTADKLQTASRLAHFIQMQDNLTEEAEKSITGTSQICTMNNQPIHLIEGDAINFKITTDSDLLIVRTLLGGK